MKNLIYAFLILLGSLNAIEEADEPNALENLEGEPSIFVRGCVNVITGDFVDSQTDLIIPGVEPFALKRSFYKWDKDTGSLGRSWTSNFDSYLKADRKKDGKVVVEASGTLEQNGGRLAFYQEYPVNDVSVSPKYLSKAVTNTSTGHISARTNIKNIKLIRKKTDKKWMVRDGAGVEKHFYHHKIVKEERPSGNQIFYDYDHSHLKSVKFSNDVGKTLASFNFEKDKKELIVTAEGQKKVCYFFQNDRLETVKSSDKPMVTYLYQSASRIDPYSHKKYHFNLINQRILPDNRYIQINYKRYKKEEEPLLAHRVKELIEPAGVDNEPIVTYRFEYDLKYDATYVYNAYNYRTSYYYDKNGRLQSIDKCRKDGNAYCRDHLYWNGHQLAARLLIPLAQYTQAACTYTYDDAGNVTIERLYGNHSGKNSISPDINHAGVGIENGCEYYEKRFSYSNNNFNLLTYETDGDYEIFYNYYPESDKPAGKIYKGKGQTYKREFFEYNEDQALTKHIVDNGASGHKDDLTGVTQRLITYYTPMTTFPIGLPEIVEEKCIDFASGEEKLISKYVNVYDQYGYLKSRTQYNNQGIAAYTLLWDYDQHGNIAKETNALGQEIFRKYDENDNLISLRSIDNIETRYTYDYMNRLVKEEEKHPDSAGTLLCTSHRYDLVGNRIATVDPYGNETLYEYDEFRRLVKTTYPAVLNQYGHLYNPMETKEYDYSGNIITITNGRHVSTHMQYTVRNQVCKIVFPDGETEENIYNLDGTVHKAIKRGGIYTIYTYDFAKNPIKQETYNQNGHLLETTSALYDAFHLLSETDAAGHTTFYEYTPEGWLHRKRKGNSETTYTYDSLGRISKTIQTYGFKPDDIVIHVQEYDLLNRVVEERTEDSSGAVLTLTGYSYDVSGNKSQIIQYTSQGKAVIDMVYDTHQDLTHLTDPEGKKTITHRSFSYYNEQGQHVPYTTTIDTNGNVISTSYDTHGRVAIVKKHSPHGQLLEQQEKRYDPSGNLLAVIDVNLNQFITTLYEYDSMNRLSKITEASNFDERRTTKIAYCRLGLKSFHTKPDGTVLNYSYDPIGRLTAYNDNFKTFSYEYEYDANHNPIVIKDTFNNTITKKTYDDQDCLIKEVLGNGLSLSYTYDRMSRPLTITLPDQTVISYTYHASKLKTVTYDGYTHEYISYDQAGNLLASKLIGNAGSLTYAYDILNRPVKTTHPKWQETLESFDLLGNLTKKTVQDASGTLTSDYSYHFLGQIATEDGVASHAYHYDGLQNCILKDGKEQKFNLFHMQLNDENVLYSYDTNGNLTDRPPEQFAYDALNRLVKHTKGNTETRYIYDSQNRRLSKSSYSSQGNDWKLESTTNYIYQNQNEIGAYNSEKIAELRILGMDTGSERGSAVAFKIADQMYAPIHDHTGSVICLLTPNGQAIESYRYSAFGIPQFSSAISPWLFSSKRLDPETGFFYFGQRYYDPHTSRWTTLDPIGDVDGPNLYAYVHNNPLTHFDAYGLYDQALFDSLHQESYLGGSGSWYQNAFDSLTNLGGSFYEGFTSNRVLGSMQALGGFTEASIGTALLGVCAPVGYAMIAHGADHAATGSYTAITGNPWQTATTQLLQKTGMSLETAADFDSKLNSVVTFGAGGIPVHLAGKGVAIAKTALVEYNAAKLGTNVAKRSGNIGNPIWSSTKERTSVQNAFYHWQKHGKEFTEIKNAKQYVEYAHGFYKSPPQGTLFKMRSNGEVLLYDKNANIFGVYTKNGTPKTIFHPEDRLMYWEIQ